MVPLKQIYVHWSSCAWFVVMAQLDQRALCKQPLCGCQQSKCQWLEKEEFKRQMNSWYDVEQQSGKQTDSLIRFECRHSALMDSFGKASVVWLRVSSFSMARGESLMLQLPHIKRLGFFFCFFFLILTWISKIQMSQPVDLICDLLPILWKIYYLNYLSG